MDIEPERLIRWAWWYLAGLPVAAGMSMVLNNNRAHVYFNAMESWAYVIYSAIVHFEKWVHYFTMRGFQ